MNVTKVPAGLLEEEVYVRTKSDRDESIRQNNLIFEASGVLESDTYKARPQEDQENLLICDAGMKVNIAGLVHDVSGLAIRQPPAPDGTQTFDSATGEYIDFKSDVDPKYGDVASTIDEARSRAAEGLVKNGDFRFGDDGSWVKQIGWDIVGNVAMFTPTHYNSSLSSTMHGLVVGESYTFSCTVSTSDVTVIRYGSPVSAVTLNPFIGSVTLSYTFVATDTTQSVGVNALNGNTNLSVTEFSVHPVTDGVVTHPVTMYGTEAGWSEAITPEHPFVYKDGCIQAQATEISGIATTKGNQPASYYACFEGDVNSIGDGVNWFELTDEQKAKVASENHVWIDADGTVVQDRLRMRSVNGLGNGDWANVDSLSGSLGYDNFVHDPDNKGVFSNTTSKFLVLGTQSRLNTGRYHQSYNPFGSLTDTDGLDWYNSTHKINSQLDAFKNVGSTPAYHYNRYANHCYSGGIGGIIDMSLDAYGVDIDSVKAKNSVLRDGSFRGKEKVVFSKSDGAIISKEELNLSVQGNIRNLDVVGDPADILANPDLKDGWLGSYAGIGSGANVDLSRKDVNTVAIGTVSTSDNGNSYAAEEGTVENTLNQSGNAIDATEVSLISYQGHSSMTEPCPNSEIVGGDVGEVFVTNANNRASFVESTIGKVATGVNDNYQELSLTETKIDGKLIGSQTHTPISIVGSTSPAVKALDYVINDNGQAKIGLQVNELIYTDSWNDNSKVEPVDDTTTGTDTGGNTRILASCKTAMPIGWLKKGVK